MKKLKYSKEKIHTSNKMPAGPRVRIPGIPPATSKLVEQFKNLHIMLHEELLNLEKIKNNDKYIKNIIENNPLFHSPMINDLPGIVFCCRIDNNRTIEFINQSCTNITGYKPSDLIINNNIAYGDIIHPEDKKMVISYLKKAVKEAKKINLKYRIITAKNKVKWVSETCGVLLFPHSDLILLEGYISDTTVEEQAIESYKESEEKYRLIFETSPVGIAVVNNMGVITDISDTVLDFTGFNREDIVGKHFTKLKTLRAADIPGYINIFTRLILGKNIKPILLNWKHKNGRIFTGEVRTSLIKKNKKITGIQIIITNRTNLIKIGKQLKDSEEFNKSILNNSTFPIYVMNTNKTMEYINPAFEKLTGFSSREIIDGRPPRPYWIKDMTDTYLESIEKVITRGVYNIELPFVNKSGKKFWVNAAERSIKSGGKIKYILGNFVDITERKETYDRLEKVLNDIIDTLSSIVEARDPYTAGHQKRVTTLAVKIANELKFDEEKIKFIEIAARLHDIGKINIPSSILSKPGKLSEIEFNIVKTHPSVGFDFVKKIDFRYPVAEIILQHHEREDGSGYPRGLKGKDIVPEAKIIGVADVVEAMSSHRPYRPARGIQAAINEIRKNKGKLYNPRVVDACIKVLKRKNFSFDDQ